MSNTATAPRSTAPARKPPERPATTTGTGALSASSAAPVAACQYRLICLALRSRSGSGMMPPATGAPSRNRLPAVVVMITVAVADRGPDAPWDGDLSHVL